MNVTQQLHSADGEKRGGFSASSLAPLLMHDVRCIGVSIMGTYIDGKEVKERLMEKQLEVMNNSSKIQLKGAIGVTSNWGLSP